MVSMRCLYNRITVEENYLTQIVKEDKINFRIEENFEHLHNNAADRRDSTTQAYAYKKIL